MKKKVVTPSRTLVGKKKLYAIFNRNNRLIKKASLSEKEMQGYLNQNANKGKAYYAIELKGLSRQLSPTELKPLENRIAKGKETLPTKDLAALKALLKMLKTKPAREAMIKAFHFDTALREEIPVSLWKKMGGETL